MPDFLLEQEVEGIVAGVDEAGRGPWAGPVVAAAVILDQKIFPKGIGDSKKLTAKKRDVLFEQIQAQAKVGVGIASVEEIDQLNILGATKLAMQRAVAALPIRPDVALIDGNQPPILPYKTLAVIKGDDKSLSIAAASIIAKVTRDRIMLTLDQLYKGYGWAHNAGYGTKDHQEALAELGITPHHRRSFRPVRELLENKANG